MRQGVPVNDIEQRLEYLEETNEALKMQNRVLAAALKGLLRGLPPKAAQNAIESIRLSFEDELAALEYEENPYTDLFHDATYAFFREKG